MMWLTWPILFVVGITTFMLRPEVVLELTPSPWAVAQRKPDSLFQPIYPRTMLQTWDLAYLACQVENDENVLSLDIKLDGKTTIIRREQLLNMRTTLVEMESRKSIFQHVRGCFTFVNFIWLLSIVGIVTTASPVLMLIARPVHQLIRYLAIEMILPFLRAIKPVYEAVAWMLCYSIVVQAYRYNNTDSQVFICLTGLLGSILAMVYTTYLHVPKMRPADYQALVSVLFATSALPLAIRFNSVLIGFFGVVALYNALGFGVCVCDLCYMVGFETESALERCLLSSLMLLIGILWGHVVHPELVLYLRPLLPALNTLGSVMYFLALLIKTHTTVYRGYWQMQVWMILSLLIVSAVGSIYQVDAVRNVAMVFTVLYIMEKISDLAFMVIPNLTVAIFVISVLLWRFSLYLHQHPGIIISLFTGM